MTPLDAVPPGIAVLVAVCLVIGAAFALIGSIGLMRLGTFHERIHAPTLGTTFGAAFIALGSMMLFSALESRPVLAEVVLLVFVAVTTPVTYMLLLRASVLRDSETAASGAARPESRDR